MQRLHAGSVFSKDALSARLERIASDKGFVISDNEGSGNCMFHALSEQLNLVKGITISHEKLRHSIVQYLRNNPKLVGEVHVFCSDVVVYEILTCVSRKRVPHNKTPAFVSTFELAVSLVDGQILYMYAKPVL